MITCEKCNSEIFKIDKHTINGQTVINIYCIECKREQELIDTTF